MPGQKIDHEFTHPQLDYNSEPNFQPCIKVSVFFKKIDSIDYDTFFGHWQTVHADLAVATHAFRDHIGRYAQHHQTPEMKDRARSLGEGFLDYDGCAQLWVKTWYDWMAFYNSKEYAAALSDDCNKSMALPMTYMVGHENSTENGSWFTDPVVIKAWILNQKPLGMVDSTFPGSTTSPESSKSIAGSLTTGNIRPAFS